MPLCLHIAAQAASGQRCLVGTAGCAAAGKTTWVELLRLVLAALDVRATVHNMDSYHLRNDELVARGLRQDKGRPWTFDVAAFVADLTAARPRTQ